MTQTPPVAYRQDATLEIDAAAIPERDRVEAVRTAIWERVVRVEIEQPPAPAVDARCRLRAMGALTLCSVRANARTIRRTRRLAADDLEPSLFLGLQVSGTSIVVQDGRQAVLRPGEMALYDTTRPYTLVNDGGIDHHYFRIPRAALALPARAVDDAVAVTFGREHPLVDVASAFFGRLAEQEDLSVPDLAAIATPSTELLRAMILTRQGATRLAREPLTASLAARALDHARRHLADPALDAASIAAALHVSVRHLYAAMAAADVSLAGWIRSRRLEACRIELGRPGARRATIASIAGRWGFVDPAHFSRAFRAEFGVSPREWRALHLIADEAGRGVG